MAKTIVIVGAGETIGFSVAREFGRRGFNVGLIARSPQNLQALADKLAAEGVNAVKVRAADVTRPAELQAALQEIKDEWGAIDVLEYSPAMGFKNYKPVMDVDGEVARAAFDLLVGGAIDAVKAVLPGMLERKGGALLFVSGVSAVNPIPFLANVGVASAGLRNYLGNLHGALSPQGVYVGAIYVGGVMKRGSPVDPDKIAATLFDMCERQDRAEEIVLGPPPPSGPPPKT